MATERWNVVHLLHPSAASSSRITFNPTNDSVVSRLLEQGARLSELLGSHALQMELRVLYGLRYVLQNSFRQHRPFRAIKQVEQCVNRLNEMNLHQVLNDLEELCPDKMQRDVGLEIGLCNVPSQPTLEWFCLRLLGASKLVCRTLDQCQKAFLLTRQHLRLSEFVVLNLVLTSMLSRLWVFFRGILRALVPVYQSAIELCQVVSRCHSMPYLKDFTLPRDLVRFLDTDYSDLLQEKSRAEHLMSKLAPKASVIDRLFAEKEKDDSEEDEVIEHMLVTEGLNAGMDRGSAVSRQDLCYSSSPSGLDIKSMLQQTHGVTKQCAAEVCLKTPPPEWSANSKSAIMEQKRIYLQLLKSASSFTMMVLQLEEIVDWCRRCKLHPELRHLAFLLLSCRRMKALEHSEINLQKKLRRFRLKVQHVMLNGVSLPRSPAWRTRGCLRTRFITLMTRYGSVRNRLSVFRRRSHVAKDLFGVTAKFSKKGSKKLASGSLLHRQIIKEELLVRDVPLSQKEDTVEVKSVKKNEIDDIFASIGF